MPRKLFSTLCLLLVCTLLLLAGNTARAQHANVPASGTVTANLRSGPGTGSAIIGGAAPGQTIRIAACNADCSWYQLASGEWISSTTIARTAPARTNGGHPLGRQLRSVLSHRVHPALAA